MLLLLAIILLLPITATADIYRYVDEEGVECFTDTPSGRKAVVYMKEARPARKFPNTISSKMKAASPSAKVSYTTEKNVTPALFPVSGRITSVVGLRNDPIDGMLRNHQGFDIAAPLGTPIRPVTAGRTLFSGNRQGYGNTVVIEHDDGMRTVYAHNSVNFVSAGDVVSATTVLGLTGSSGRSTGPHLHFEAWQDGVNVTSSLMAGHYGSAGSAGNSDDGIRRLVNSDGSLVFTNLR